MSCKIFIIVYSIVQFIAFLFVLVGTPIDQFRGKNQDVIGNTPCLTLWGLKDKCYSTKYTTKTNTLWAMCSGRKDRFRAGEAFSILSICIYGVASVFGFIMLCCCDCFRWVCLVLNILGVITGVVTWALMANNYYTSFGVCAKLKTLYKYGAGFALILTGWCLCFVNIIFLMLPC